MAPDGPSSSILFRNAPAGLDRRNLRRFLQILVEEVANDVPFTCLITNDRELQRLNREFLGKDYPTDVLSFPAPDGAGGVASPSGRAPGTDAPLGPTLEQE